MPLENIILDVVIMVLSVICAYFCIKVYMVTRAIGLGFIALGFIWAIVSRIVILFSLESVLGYRSWFVLPVFIFYTIGIVLVYCSLITYYNPKKKCIVCTLLEKCHINPSIRVEKPEDE
jgi:membrane associated rhomboid family serine protease